MIAGHLLDRVNGVLYTDSQKSSSSAHTKHACLAYSIRVSRGNVAVASLFIMIVLSQISGKLAVKEF